MVLRAWSDVSQDAEGLHRSAASGTELAAAAVERLDRCMEAVRTVHVALPIERHVVDDTALRGAARRGRRRTYGRLRAPSGSGAAGRLGSTSRGGPGCRTGLIRRTSLVQVDHEAGHYLVSLAGESEWVRNVRAAGGRAVLGRRKRRAVTLIEVPAAERAPVIDAYLHDRTGRPAVNRTAEARHFFGVDPDLPGREIDRVGR